MRIYIENFQIATEEGQSSTTTYNLSEVIELAKIFNEKSTAKITIYSKPSSPEFLLNAENNRIELILSGIDIPEEARPRLVQNGYLVIYNKLLLISHDTKQLLKDVFSNDPHRALNALTDHDSFNASSATKQDIANVLREKLQNHHADNAVSLRIDLYQYQNKGVEWLIDKSAAKKGALLADDMGLGKTAQVIAFIVDGISKGRLRNVLIIVPNSLITNWEREIAKFATGLQSYIHWGNARAGFPQQIRDERIIISTYSTVVNDLSLFEELNFDLLVCDEASLLKNPHSSRTESINKLKYAFSILITGTPFENSLTDVWSITNILEKEFLGPEEQFFKKYGSLPLNELEKKDLSRIQKLIEPLMLRRLKEEVLDDLPEKLDIHTALNPKSNELEGYRAIIDEIKSAENSKTLALIAYLRKFTSHPALYEGNILDISFDKMAEQSAKFTHTVQLVREILKKKEKVLIFANHIDLLAAMKKTMAQHFQVPCFKIDGSVEIRERQNVLDVFEQVETGAILLLNPIAAGMGLNITAANHVIHFSRQWNPALEAQATARAFRNGQTKSVNAYYLYYANTVEELIHDRINLKSYISKAIIKPFHSINDDDLYLQALEEL
jgi:SNF2 family DNA or RNA helicase